MAKMGRPRIEINLLEAEKLGRLQCTLEECSAWLGVKLSTLSNRKDFLEVYKRGKEQGKTSLRRHQFKLAEKNATMAIWLGKQYLDQKDERSQENKEENVTEQLKAIALAISKSDTSQS